MRTVECTHYSLTTHYSLVIHYSLYSQFSIRHSTAACRSRSIYSCAPKCRKLLPPLPLINNDCGMPPEGAGREGVGVTRVTVLHSVILQFSARICYATNPQQRLSKLLLLSLLSLLLSLLLLSLLLLLPRCEATRTNWPTPAATCQSGNHKYFITFALAKGPTVHSGKKTTKLHRNTNKRERQQNKSN